MNVSRVNELLLGTGIRVTGSHRHAKASEEYVDIEVTMDGKQVWEGAVPYHYRRTGLFLDTEEELAKYLTEIRPHLEPSRVSEWVVRERAYWEDHGGDVTPLFFRALLSMDWVYGADFPRNNNPQRRLQDIKEMGYTLGTKREGREFKRKLVPLPRGAAHGYETISPQLRERILQALGSENVYEQSTANRNGLIPDHKFPEIRWDDGTRAENPASMTDEELKAKFQLLDNQRNQQKREMCRQCFQSGKRGIIFGVEFFYEGTIEWPTGVPQIGKAAESGCVGCGWYDVAKWRSALADQLGHSS